MKAIHNCHRWRNYPIWVVINHKITKFESNSQLNARYTYRLRGCYQSRNYKIWKQFTTHFESLRTFFTLLSITKLQNLKAIHNWCYYLRLSVKVVINHKITKFESNSQRINPPLYEHISCYQSQNYKIWKQFTTYGFSIVVGRWLLSITKLQNLKAIHNTSYKR